MIAKKNGCVLLKGNIAPDGIFLCTSQLPEKMWIVRGTVCKFYSFLEARKALTEGDLQRGAIILVENQDPVEAACFWNVLKKDSLAQQVVIFCAYPCQQAMDGAVCLYWTTASPPQQLHLLLDGDVLCYDLTTGNIHLDLAEEGFAARTAGEQMPLVITKLNPSTFSILSRYSRMFLLIGSKHALLIDAGFYVPTLRQILTSLTDKPVKLALTHSHHDHIGNISHFNQVWLHKKELPLFSQNVDYKGELGILTDGEAIPLGDRNIYVQKTPGHTPGSVSFYDPKTASLFPGDTVSSDPIYMFLNGSCLKDFCGSLKKLIDISPELQKIYPAHGKLLLGRDDLIHLFTCVRKVMNGEITGVGTCISRVPGKCKTYKYCNSAIFY